MVSGPSASPTTASRRARAIGVAHPIVLTVPQGTIIVRAIDPGAAPRPDYRDASARYFVMHDDAALSGLDLRRITAATDAAGQPAINATLTPAGARAFHALTATVAHRGSRLRLPGAPDYQHIAIIIDGALTAVPLIDYNTYPDGVFGSSSIEIEGGLSRPRANAVSDALRLRTLPLRVTIASGR
jgi:preprotein translocase subunit SecD